MADVRGIARLARIELGADEERRLGADLARILAAFHALERVELDADDGELDVALLPAARADEPADSLAREALLERAPASADGFYRVPKTVGGDA